MTSEGIRSVFRGTVALAIAVLVLRGDGGSSPLTLVVLAIALGYVAASTVTSWRSGGEPVPVAAHVGRAAGDLLALCAVIVAVDNPPSELLLFLCAVPLGYSLTLPAPAIAGLTAGAIVAALAIWALSLPVHPEPLTNGDLLITSFGLVWSGLVACLIALERERRAHRIDELSDTLQNLIAQVITAEETERQRVADLLHDDVLQLLLVTRHDVNDALDGDDAALPQAADEIDLATRHLRDTIGGLRSEGVASSRLGQGLLQLGAQTTERRGCAVVVDVSPELDDGPHPLALSLGRDLLREVERRSSATSVHVRAYVRAGDLVLTVGHDDPRYVASDVASAASELITAVDQRARAVGGSLAIRREPDGDRTYTVAVPLRPAAALAPPTGSAPRIRRASPAVSLLDVAPTSTLETSPDVHSR